MDAALQQLKDIHLPKAVNSWLIAPGWLCLYALLITLAIYLIYFFYQGRRRRLAVKHALSRLKVLENYLIANPDNINIAAEISTLLRRTALYYFPRDRIAGLCGRKWLHFLNRSGHTKQFSKVGSLLIHAPYRQHDQSNLSPLFAAARAWLATIAKNKSLTAEK